MRTKRNTVCHTCRRHKIGCDGKQPACTQCSLTGRECGGYVQEMMVLQHKPSTSTRESKIPLVVENSRKLSKASEKQFPQVHGLKSLSSSGPSALQPTWEESIRLLTQHYIPKDELPFLSSLDCPSARICGGWVQALPHVSQSDADFGKILLPAVRAMTLSMMVTDANSQQEFLDTYGIALHGIKACLAGKTDRLNNIAALASMCLTLSEVLMPTSGNGWKSHLRGVAAMMSSRGPQEFMDGIPHLLFVGFRPLIVLDSISQRKNTFLMEAPWQEIPFSTQQPSCMQTLLGHCAVIPRLLEKLDRKELSDLDAQDSLLEIKQTLQDWETKFVRSDNSVYRPVAPSRLDLSVDVRSLPDPCFDFLDVSSANSLSHCWSFQIVCLLELLNIAHQSSGDIKPDCDESNHSSNILDLCTLICRGLPYLLQNDMALYGPLSVGFPLRIVLESIEKLRLDDSGLARWSDAIERQLALLGIPSMKVESQ